MTSDLTIQRADPAHVDGLIALDQKTRSDPHRVELIRQWVADRECTVATLDGRPAGYAVLTHHFYEQGFVEMLQVDVELRRRGIGTALMMQMRAECATERLFTSTNLSNRPMQDLLAKLGFRLSTVLHYVDDDDPELLYVHLGGGS